jgi:hypothetical protein
MYRDTKIFLFFEGVIGNSVLNVATDKQISGNVMLLNTGY